VRACDQHVTCCVLVTIRQGRQLDITTVWLTDEGMPSKGIMRLRYVTNKGCAVPALRGALAAETLVGPGKEHLIPSHLRKKEVTPRDLRSSVDGS
jgi:hypothetical protein